jgi:uncharacterized protein YecT (DUF1311 family)
MSNTVPLRWVLLSSLALAAPAMAGAVEECLLAGNPAAVARCLNEEEAKVNGELATAEAAAARRAREIEQATGHAGVHAALAKSVRDFAQYRTSQCAYVKESYAGNSGAVQAQTGCRIDVTRRRIRELKP